MALDDFLNGYIECALWLADPEPGQGEWAQHDEYTRDNLAAEALARMTQDCAAFEQANRADLDEANDTYFRDDEHLGHDFWLNRNRHGTGFGDRGMEEVGERLSAAADKFRECDLYLGDDGRIHHS
jgi:hypothetical protein